MTERAIHEQRLHRACLEAVPDVLETMFFEPLVSAPASRPLPLDGALDVSEVSFEGSGRGRLRLAAPSQLTNQLTDSFLADAEREGVANGPLVLAELANMLCGRTLGHLQPQGVFRLSTPAAGMDCPAPAIEGRDRDWLCFPLENGPLYVELTLEA